MPTLSIRKHLAAVVGLAVFAAAVGVYLRTAGYPFISLDDHLYVTQNPFVREGLSMEALRWAFTDAFRYANYWIPLTWLTFLIDGTVYGTAAGGFHATNVLLHGVNSAILFAFLHRATRRLWPAAVVAAVFALHPLHVESVAWVTERKDVLSMFFWLLALLFYARYAERPAWTGYAAVLIFFCCGVMAKPMVVTLPFVLLLLDYWPLRRISFEKPEHAAAGSQLGQAKRVLVLAAEKIPLLAISGGAMALALATQDKGGAIVPVELVPIETRLLAVPVFYTGYLLKMVWPADLALVYPYPDQVPVALAAGAVLFLAAVSAVAVKARRSEPYLIVGWLWYLGTFVPVIGLVAIGPQGMADRYTYIPLVGIYIAVVWAAAARVRGSKKAAAAAAALLLIGFFAVRTHQQVSLWRSSEALYGHTLAVTEDNWFVHNLLGLEYKRQGRMKEAVAQFEASLRIARNNPAAHVNLAVALAGLGRNALAASHFREALALDPMLAPAHNGFGNLLLSQGRIGGALDHFNKAVALRPGYATAHYNLGRALVQADRPNEALEHYLEAVERDPHFTEAYNNTALLMLRFGKRSAAVELLQEALRIDPGSELLLRNLAVLKKSAGSPGRGGVSPSGAAPQR